MAPETGHCSRRGTQVVRERSAKPLYVGSIPTRASSFCNDLALQTLAFSVAPTSLQIYGFLPSSVEVSHAKPHSVPKGNRFGTPCHFPRWPKRDVTYSFSGRTDCRQQGSPGRERWCIMAKSAVREGTPRNTIPLDLDMEGMTVGTRQGAAYLNPLEGST